MEREKAMSKFVGVYILDAVSATDMLYEYSLPERLQDKAMVGKLAVVPFGGGNIAKTAVIVSLSDTSSFEKTKPVLGIPESNFYLKKDLLDICVFLRENCFCTFGEAVRTVMPTGLAVKIDEYYTLKNGVTLNEHIYSKLNSSACDILSTVSGTGKATVRELCEKFGTGAKKCASELVRLGYLEKVTDSSFHENTKVSRYIRLALSDGEMADILESGSRLFTPKQQNVLRVLSECGGTNPLEDLLVLCSCGESVIRELKKKNAVEYVAVKDYRSPYNYCEIPKKEDFELSNEQNAALSTLSDLYFARKPKAALLYGVTGSGKTNVILKLIDKVLADGKQVIYLVPEIALTSQNIAIFAGRFGNRIAVLHSALSVGEKLDAWKRIDEGDARIVIGTRSAIFAPTNDLGLVVIDEEQESSFKSDMSPKFHARDVARFRCAKKSAMMLLASATPSVESFYRAKEERYTLVTMKNRFGKAHLPEVIIHDMKPEPAYMGDTGEGATPCMIGSVLDRHIRENLEKGEQTILFINRRGYHAFMTCRSCGTPMTCPNCSVSLTYHKYKRGGGRYSGGGEMVCHYCGHTADVPKICPTCGSAHIAFLGTGTQTLEENLEKLYPNARILRMDTDTTSGKMAHDEILDKFRKGDADILLGTQMVTKGHDFPKVTLVGVILADTSLYLNDYRACEKTFSLMTQVLGRAGRGEKPGRAVIQTYSPENDTIRLCAKQDYDSFFDGEIALRKASIFPPFCDIVTFLFSSEDEQAVKNAASAFGKQLDLYAKGEYKGTRLIVFGPFEASVYKLNGKYRIRYIIKCRYDKQTKELFKKLFREFSCADDRIHLSADVNPSSL